MFLNCSSHPSEKWSMEQRLAAETLGGEIIDYKFPIINAETSEDEIAKMADVIVARINEMHPDVVMCQGEFTLTYAVVNELKRQGIKVVAACSERLTTESQFEDGSTRKKTIFRFVRFREYK